MKTTFIVALMAAAIATSACRREAPEPDGLGAQSLIKTEVAR